MPLATNNTPDRYLYSPREAAPMIHPDLAPRTLERWRRLGIGPRYVRIGRRVGYTLEAIREYHRTQERSHTAAERLAG